MGLSLFEGNFPFLCFVTGYHENLPFILGVPYKKTPPCCISGRLTMNQTSGRMFQYAPDLGQGKIEFGEEVRFSQPICQGFISVSQCPVKKINGLGGPTQLLRSTLFPFSLTDVSLLQLTKPTRITEQQRSKVTAFRVFAVLCICVFRVVWLVLQAVIVCNRTVWEGKVVLVRPGFVALGENPFSREARRGTNAPSGGPPQMRQKDPRVAWYPGFAPRVGDCDSHSPQRDSAENLCVARERELPKMVAFLFLFTNLKPGNPQIHKPLYVSILGVSLEGKPKSIFRVPEHPHPCGPRSDPGQAVEHQTLQSRKYTLESVSCCSQNGLARIGQTLWMDEILHHLINPGMMIPL